MHTKRKTFHYMRFVEVQSAPCWDCKKPGKFRNFGAATPVYCDACDTAHRQAVPQGTQITEDDAWALTEEEGKAPPYSGGAMVLRNGRTLSCNRGAYYLTPKN